MLKAISDLINAYATAIKLSRAQVLFSLAVETFEPAAPQVKPHRFGRGKRAAWLAAIPPGGRATFPGTEHAAALAVERSGDPTLSCRGRVIRRAQAEIMKAS